MPRLAVSQQEIKKQKSCQQPPGFCPGQLFPTASVRRDVITVILPWAKVLVLRAHQHDGVITPPKERLGTSLIANILPMQLAPPSQSSPNSSNPFLAAKAAPSCPKAARGEPEPWGSGSFWGEPGPCSPAPGWGCSCFRGAAADPPPPGWRVPAAPGTGLPPWPLFFFFFIIYFLQIRLFISASSREELDFPCRSPLKAKQGWFFVVVVEDGFEIK